MSKSGFEVEVEVGFLDGSQDRDSGLGLASGFGTGVEVRFQAGG